MPTLKFVDVDNLKRHLLHALTCASHRAVRGHHPHAGLLLLRDGGRFYLTSSGSHAPPPPVVADVEPPDAATDGRYFGELLPAHDALTMLNTPDLLAVHVKLTERVVVFQVLRER